MYMVWFFFLRIYSLGWMLGKIICERRRNYRKKGFGESFIGNYIQLGGCGGGFDRQMGWFE